MEKLGLLKKLSFSECDSESLLKSSPNILENFPYEKYETKSAMTSPLAQRARLQQERSKSPVFSDTIANNLFMRHVISSDGKRSASPVQQQKKVQRSLEEISRDIKEIEDFLTVTENIIKKERENDNELYIREKKRKLEKRKSVENTNKENKTPSPTGSAKKNIQKNPNFKINSFKNKRKSTASPKFSKLYFRNGKIGCEYSDPNSSDVECTHAIIKHILKYENEKPLVSPENVEKVLNRKVKLEDLCLDQDEYETVDEKELTMTTNEDEMDDVDMCSQPVEDDERNLKINYHESPEVSNKEHLPNSAFENTEEFEMDQNNCKIKTQDIQCPESNSLSTDENEFVRDRVRNLVRRFSDRTKHFKSRIELPPTPCSESPLPPSPPPPNKINDTETDTKLNSQKSSTSNINQNLSFHADNASMSVRVGSFLCGGMVCGNNGVLDPQGKIYISWLCIVSISYLYNAWVIPLRTSFPFQTPENTNTWLILDFCADVIYLLDVIFFKHRLMYLFEGFWVKDKNLTRKNYMRKFQFKLDLLSMTPLDLLYLKYGVNSVYFRFPRLLKIQSFWEFFKLLDRVISSPHILRVAKTLVYMLYMIHLTACSYYGYSVIQGLGSNRWVFSGNGHPYVRCWAFATKTATSIGKNPKPYNDGEYVFMTCAWLMGVFVFALLIGQIRDIISTATRNKNEYRQLEDESLEYMRRLNLPGEIQQRIKMWFKFTWDQQRTLDESHILDALPINLKTDIAISVHIQTLSKVQLFADCEEALLRDLVLRLRAVTFLPGDNVCRKGEVGKEMYIVKLGQVQVMGGPDNNLVLATLSEGSVFGEISLLAMNGGDGNRRTADVKSKGFSNLFVLSKNDLNEVIVYYPNAQAILKRRARSLMQKNAAREREEAKRTALKADIVIDNPKTPESPPKLLRTVIQALPKSHAVLLVTKGSGRIKKSHATNVNQKVEKENLNDENSLVSIENEKRPKSPDLLSSIQKELQTKNINLTDSEKALIMTPSSNCLDECDITVHKEM